MQWVKIDDRYINLSLVKYTSQINSSYVTLYFNDKSDIKITGTENMQKIYEILEQLKIEVK